MGASFIIDLRCLQHPDYAERGIGNHARAIAMHVPEGFTAIIDPLLPALPQEVASRAGRISPHAYLPDAGQAVFLNPSPMGPGQNFVARLLLDRRITKAACVHDFIPYDDPQTHLSKSAAALAYHVALAWLRRYDAFFPVSEATNDRLQSLFGPVRAWVTGAALPGWFGDIPPEPPRHILMAGGGDPRKNSEVLIRAHGGSEILGKIPLVITGQQGIAPRGVEFPGRLSAAGLRRLYAQAFCVVVPSRAEGFSLPVIEAMAAGTPAIVSDIPAHRALVADPGTRFAPDDAAGLAAILEGILLNPARRRAIIAGQAGGWRPFTGEAVAGKILTRLNPGPAIRRGAKPRLAMLTPMPPAKSGIADYSAALVPELSRLVELDVFAGSRLSAAPHVSGKYDAVVSVIGNSPHHSSIYNYATRFGAAVICHDSRLLGLIASRGLAEGARMAARELGRAVSETEICSWAMDETRREASFLGEIAAAGHPLMFHSQAPIETVLQRFGVAARHLPFAMQRLFDDVSPAAKARARAALDLPERQKIIASFGFIGPQKGIAAGLHAFALLRQRIDARLIFAGEATPATAGYQRLAETLGVAPAVTFGAAFCAEAGYRDMLLAADLGLQLREAPPGNISGALADCIAAGLPSIATNDLAGNVMAPGYVRRVSDRLDPAEIAGAMLACLSDPPPTLEHRDYCARYSMANYARRLLEVLGL